jgi:hypothetical protein
MWTFTIELVVNTALLSVEAKTTWVADPDALHICPEDVHAMRDWRTSSPSSPKEYMAVSVNRYVS